MSPTTGHPHTLISLPTEILILIIYPLDHQGLAALSETCRALHRLVSDYGWPQFMSYRPRPSFSLSSTRKLWPSVKAARYDVLTDHAWQNAQFVARPLSRTFPAKEQSTLAISRTRLIVAAGTFLHSYSFKATETQQPGIQLEGSISLNETHVRGRNITTVTFIDDGGLDQTLLVAYQEHLVERITLIPPTPERGLSFSRTGLPGAFPKGDYIESFSTSSGHILSLASGGTARLYKQNALDNIPVYPEIVDLPASRQGTPPTSGNATPKSGVQTPIGPPGSIAIGERSWKCHLSLTSSTPFAAFGSTGATPLTIHAIDPSTGLSPTPTTILHTERCKPGENSPSSAVYGIATAPPQAPWGASPQILATGWFDGKVRIYDLRMAAHAEQAGTAGENPLALTASINGGKPLPLLRPVQTFGDRWSTEPIYSVSCGGGSGAHIAAGTARHSVVSFWDVRNPKAGWSVYAPGNDRSPVFNVILESSRLFGTTEMRPFVYDFGPDATADMYPSMSSSSAHSGKRDRDVLKHKPGILSYRVTKYRHAKGLTDGF